MEKQVQIVPQDKPIETGIPNFMGQNAIRCTFEHEEDSNTIQQSFIIVFPSYYKSGLERFISKMMAVPEDNNFPQIKLETLWEQIQEIIEVKTTQFILLVHILAYGLTISKMYEVDNISFPHDRLANCFVNTHTLSGDDFLDIYVAKDDGSSQQSFLTSLMAFLSLNVDFTFTYEFFENAPISLGKPLDDGQL